MISGIGYYQLFIVRNEENRAQSKDYCSNICYMG